MFEKVAVFERRFEEISQLLCEEQTLQNPERYTALLRESSEIQPLVEEYRRFRAAEQQEQEARALLDAYERYCQRLNQVSRELFRETFVQFLQSPEQP